MVWTLLALAAFATWTIVALVTLRAPDAQRDRASLSTPHRRLFQWLGDVRWTVAATFVFFAVAILVALYGHYSLYGGNVQLAGFAQDFYSNYFADILGILATVLLIDRLNRLRDEKREAQIEEERRHREEVREKETLIAQLGSRDLKLASYAANRLRMRGWLQDGTLRGMYFGNAKWVQLDFSHADLREAVLPQADCVNCIFDHANLSGADLTRIQFHQSVLCNTDMSNAVLNGARISKSLILNTKFNAAKMRNIQLSEAVLYQISVTDADMAGADLQGLDLRSVSFHDTLLSNAYLSDVNLSNSSLEGVDLADTILERAVLCGADLRKTTLRNTSFREALYNYGTQWPPGFDYRRCGAWGPEAELENADFSGVRFRGVDLTNANLRCANLTGATFESVLLKNADLSEAVMRGIRRRPADTGSGNVRFGHILGSLPFSECADSGTLLAKIQSEYLSTSVDLSGAVLWKADLTDAHLGMSDLSHANFKEARLLSTNLYQANLLGANFQRAFLSGADLTDACLCGADLRELEEVHIELIGAEFDDHTLWSDWLPHGLSLPVEIIKTDTGTYRFMDKRQYK